MVTHPQSPQQPPMPPQPMPPQPVQSQQPVQSPQPVPSAQPAQPGQQSQPPVPPQPVPPAQPVQSAQSPQQMPAQGFAPQQFPAETRRKVHHSYIWLSSIQLTLTLAIVFAFSLIPVFFGGEMAYGDGMFDGGVLAVVATFVMIILIVGLVIGAQALSYRHLSYEIGEKEFTLYSGIFSKKQVHVPYQRIQSVNQRATLSQRILGVCTVHIDTAGGSSNKAVVVPYLQKSEAERLRTELFARKQFIVNGHANAQSFAQGVHSAPAPGTAVSVQEGNIFDVPAEIVDDARGIFGGSKTDLGAVSFQYKLTNKELLFTGFSNTTGVALMMIAVIASVLGILSQVLETTIGQEIYNQGMAFATKAFSDKLTWVIVGIVIVSMFVIWLFSVAGTCISFGGFKASRRQSRIEVEYGVLQHHFHGVDVDRVQSVIIKQSFIRRLIGYCELSLGKIDAASESSSEEQQKQINLTQGLIIHPFVKMNRVPEILAGLVPEFADVPTEQISLPKVSLRRALVRRCILLGNGFWLAIAITVALIAIQIFSTPLIEVSGFADFSTYSSWIALAAYILCALIAVVEAVNAVFWYQGSSFAYNRYFMQITNGGFSRESISFPRKKIQYAFTKTNPFQRMSHVVSVNVRTAAGIGGTTMKLVDVREKDADRWLEWVKPGQAVVK